MLYYDGHDVMYWVVFIYTYLPTYLPTYIPTWLDVSSPGNLAHSRGKEIFVGNSFPFNFAVVFYLRYFCLQFARGELNYGFS